jgi:tripartite-type tricarboxylate transporter receptor subunit TctC
MNEEESMMRASQLRSLCGMTIALAAAHTGAQTAGADRYPERPIRLVVPSAPGGGTDIIARLIAQGFNDAWGQTVVVDNRGGAGGQAGVTIVAKQSAPDGYTMLLGSVGHLSFVPAVRRNVPYDPQRDLTPISLAAVQPFVVAVSNAVPAKSIAELVTAARNKPKSLSYGSGGVGAASHLGVVLLELKGGFQMLHVAYKGSNPAITAVMANEIQMALAGLSTVLPHARAGKLKALAVTGAKRAQFAPDVPTVAESGVPDYAFDVWYGLVYSGGTPRPIVAKAQKELVRMLQSPEISKRFASVGVEARTNTSAEFAELVKREVTTWRKIVQDAGIQLE